MSNEIKIKISSEANTSGMKQAKAALHDVETASDKAGNAIAALDRKISGLDGKKVKVELDMPKGVPSITGGDQKVKVKVGVEADESAGPSFMSKFADTAGKAAGPVSKLLGSRVGITLGASAAAAAAPVLAAGLGSLLSSGAGAGVIGAGVALAVSGDKQIQAAGQDAGKRFLKGMQEEAKVFAGPIRESLGLLEDAGVRMTRRWGDAFEALSGDLKPFVEDVISGTERISNALTDAAEGSGKEALDGLGDAYKLLADGVGDFVDTVADGGPQAADNLRLIAGATADVARQTGNFLDVLNKAASNEWITGPLLPALRDHYRDASEETGTFARRTVGASEAMQQATEAAMGEKGALEALSTELKAQADPVFGIMKAQQDLAAAQEETALATREHGKDSDEARNALSKQALAALALESNIGKLGDSFTGTLSPAMRATMRAAGMTDDAIDRLEKEFRAAKKAGDRFADTYRARAVLDGYRNANGQLNGLLRDLQRFDGVWTATMITNYVKHGKPGTGGGLASGGIKGAANGGIRNDLTWVGESGPELLDLPPGSRVHSNPDSTRMAAGGGGGLPGGVLTVNLVVDGRVLAQTMMDPQRELIGNQFGGNVQSALGRG